MGKIGDRTWVCQGQWFPSFPTLHLEQGQVANNSDESIVVYMRIDHPKFCSLPAESVLMVVALKIVHSVHAFLVEHSQTFVGSPTKLDDFALIPLFTRNNSVSGVREPGLGRTERIKRLSPAGEYNCI